MRYSFVYLAVQRNIKELLMFTVKQDNRLDDTFCTRKWQKRNTNTKDSIPELLSNIQQFCPIKRIAQTVSGESKFSFILFIWSLNAITYIIEINFNLLINWNDWHVPLEAYWLVRKPSKMFYDVGKYSEEELVSYTEYLN